LIRFTDVRKEFYAKNKTIKALDGLTFDVGEGEIVGLLGPNGAGKSTSVKILSTIILPTSGEVTVKNYNILTQAKEIREYMVVILQGNAVDLWLDVKENLKIFGYFHGLKGKNLVNQIDKVINIFELEQYLNTKAGDLSGGYRRRLQVAKAFLVQSPILILDEPTEGMDPIIKQQCLKLIKMEAQSGRTILLTTQRLDEAEEICNSIIIIKNGSTLIQGPINEIKKVIGESFQVKLCFDQVTAEIEAEIRKMKMIEEVNINYKESYLEFIINKKVYNPLEIINQFTQNHCVTKFEVKEPSLETVFMKIIQRKEENK
jgi:ABC-2 type transport system ATP-binding protein